MANKDCTAIYYGHQYDDVTMRALRQAIVLTPATKVAVDRLVMQPITNFTYVIKPTNVYV
jgi:hypothetical protein